LRGKKKKTPGSNDDDDDDGGGDDDNFIARFEKACVTVMFTTLLYNLGSLRPLV